MPTVQIAKDISVRTFAVPPKGFDPLASSSRAGARYGYPPRPEEPTLAKLWEEALAVHPRVVQPRFRLLDEEDLDLDDLAARDGLGPIEKHPFLCGGQVKPQSNQGDIRWVESTWTVPNIYPRWNSSEWLFSCASWLGISGAIPSSLQAGVFSRVRTYRGKLERVYYPWWRWAPRSTVAISNFSVVAGDVLSCVVCMDLGSAVKATLFFNNLTSKQATTLKVTAPSGTQLNGNTAAWMIQAEKTGPDLYRLARMGVMYFDRCNAGVTETADVLNPRTLFFMTPSGSSQDVARVGQLSDTLLQVSYAGE